MSQDNSFTNKNTMVAIVLSAIVLFGWQFYLGKKYPNMNAKAAPTTTIVESEVATTAKRPEAPSEKTKTSLQAQPKEQKLSFVDDEQKFELSSAGMSLNEYTLRKHLDREKKPTVIGEQGQLFSIHAFGHAEPLAFNVQEKGQGEFEGVANIGETKIIQKMIVDSKTHSISHTIRAENISKDFLGLEIVIPEAKHLGKKTSFLLPSFEHQDFIVNHQKKTEKINISSSKEDIQKSFGEASMVAVSSQYFAAAISDNSEIAPEAVLYEKTDDSQVRASLAYKAPVGLMKFELKFITYAGPKDYYLLKGLDSSLVNIIDYGWFTSIGTILLGLLKWLYSFVGNWGWSIVILTLVVRALVLPFAISSYKSMKKMQKIQPLMASIRERYKDDPQSVQRETMALMREHKVNPLGSCLPMLLQMPVFFALYQVLAQSIDLYQAPWMFWIKDLSLKDPYYILPILMGITMWYQQKTTPSTMDPQQQKIMQFLPIVFSLMMISLPSGLTLYIFVSTLFGALQQKIFTKDRTVALSVKQAKA